MKDPGRPRHGRVAVACRAWHRQLCAVGATAACAIACVAAAPAAAHAFLDHALPAVGSTVHEPPTSVRLWFTEALEPAFSRVHVVDAAGKDVDAGDSHVDGTDRMILTANLRTLASGSYRVVWRVVSVDTHVTEGDFTFDVK